MKKVVLLVLVLVCSGNLYAQKPKTYNPEATAESLGLTPFVLPEDFFPVYPWGWFPTEVKPYETLETSLPGVRDCGFNLAGFIPPEELGRCDALGL
jgi:hypothetical protein